MSYSLPPLRTSTGPAKGLEQPRVLDEYNRQLMEHVGQLEPVGYGWRQAYEFIRHDNGTYPRLGRTATGEPKIEIVDVYTGLPVNPIAVNTPEPVLQPVETNARWFTPSSRQLADW